MRRYPRWSQLKVLSAWKRGTAFLMGRPTRSFPPGFRRLGICARMPLRRTFFRSGAESYPLSVARTLTRFRGRPGRPVLTLTALRRGSTCRRSSALSGVTVAAKGMPCALVWQWMRTPLPLYPYATSSPPPLPGGKRAIDGSILPVDDPVLLGESQQPGLQTLQGAIFRPLQQGTVSGAARGPLFPLGHIAPTASRDQHVQGRVQHKTRRRRLPPSRTLLWGRRKQILEQLLLQLAQPFKSTRHRPSSGRILHHIKGIGSPTDGSTR